MSSIQTWTMVKPELEDALTDAMRVTVAEMVAAGLVNQTRANKWLDEHVCVIVTTSPMWTRFRRMLGLQHDKPEIRIAKILGRPEPAVQLVVESQSEEQA